MSNPSPQTPRTEKSMSSRLMTMKFMQRAAALPSASSNPNSPDIPSPKRRKFSSTTASTALTPPSEAQAIQAVMKAEEDKISQAVDRLAAEAGETKWSLSFVDEVGGVKETGGLQVVTVGYSQIDLGGGKGHGRMSFGTVNRAAEKRQDSASDRPSSSSIEASEAEDEDSNDDGDDPAGANDLIRESKEEANLQLRAKRTAEKRASKINLVQLAKMRNNKEVKLNNLTSISGGKPSNAKGNRWNIGEISVQGCYKCGQKGHRQANCPQLSKGKRKNGFGDHAAADKSRVSLDY